MSSLHESVTIIFQKTVLYYFFDSLYILFVVLLEKLSRLIISWRLGIRIAEEGLNRGEDARDVVDWRPHILEDVQADGPVVVYIGVKHFG